jgi:hypothetical protein
MRRLVFVLLVLGCRGQTSHPDRVNLDRIIDDCVRYERTYSTERCRLGTRPLGRPRPADMSIEACVGEWMAGVQEKCRDRALEHAL